MRKLCYPLMLLLWILPFLVSAQETVEQEPPVEREKIKEIKLSESYVFATAVTEENLTEAQQNSMDLLRANVNAIFAERFQMEKEDVEEIWDVIEDKCQNVTIKKGDLFRVFSYILKDYLFPGKKKKSKKELSVDNDSSNEAVRMEDIAKVSEAVANETLPLDAQERIMAFVPSGEKEIPIDSLAEKSALANLPPEKADTLVGVDTQPVVSVLEATEEAVSVRDTAFFKVSKPKEDVPVSHVEVTPAVIAPYLDLVVEELLLVQTFKDLIVMLDQKKEEGVLIYGRVKTMLSPEKCYLAVFKDGQMVTILDKGDNERLNLKTNTPDSLNNYKGHGVIWFQLFK